MSTAGLGLTKSGSSSFDNQIPISTVAGDTLPDRRRASITDPCLHAHSTLSQVNPPSNSQSAQDHLGGRSYTLPSFRELSRHSKNSAFVSHTTQTPSTLQPPHSLDHVPARRRGSAADLDHILLSSNSDSERPHHQSAVDYSVSPTSNLSFSEQQITHHHPFSHPPHPYTFNSFSFDSSLPSVQLPSRHSNTPVSPRSFSSASLTHQSDSSLLPAGPGANRRSTSIRRRSSRANELDVTRSEDPARALAAVPGSNLHAPPHARGFQAPAGPQWPYPAPHHRHHLQKPLGPVKRRGSSQSIPESTAPSSNCFGIAPDQSCGPIDQPWNAFRLISNHSQREIVGDTPSVLGNYRLNARRQSEASSASSTGMSYDRRQSGASGEYEGTDDGHNLPPMQSLRRRSCSSSSKHSVMPFSPTQTAVACIGDYALPPLPYKEELVSSPAFTTSGSSEHVALADRKVWSNSLDDQTVVGCGPAAEDVYELKDKLAATQLLDRHSHHPHSVTAGTLPCGPVLCQVDQQDRPSNPYSRSPELKISHKLAERKRRKEMRDLFEELREVLPVADERHSKGSKWEILSRAVDYMQQLKLENEELRKENLGLQSQVNPTNRRLLNFREDQNRSKYSSHNTPDGFG